MLVFGLAGCGSDADGTDTVMPDVTGKSLDAAKSDVERAGFTDDVEVLGGGLFGVVEDSNWEVCEQSPAAGELVKDAPRLTVDRSCGEDSGEATQEPDSEETEPAADAYNYTGTDYEVVVVDEDVSAAKLMQHWVYTAELDTSAEAYKDQVKLIIANIAHNEGTDRLIVQVVTDREIAEAEALSTWENFLAEHGNDYTVNTIPEKEKSGWVASYTGGFDYDRGEPSDDAFAIDWWPYGDLETEQWRPQAVG